MRRLAIARPGEPLTVLCLGAHADDIEIGVGGIVLSWIAAGVRLNVHWCVMSANGPRETEAEKSAEDFLRGAAGARIELNHFTDSFFPEESREIKAWFNELRLRIAPDVIFTHRSDDAHQDHKVIARLTWNTFRHNLIFGYEIPKWDGDMGQPNAYMPIGGDVIERKIALLVENFGTQRSKDWFDAETFRGLARLRGMECRSSTRYAEGLFAGKIMLG